LPAQKWKAEKQAPLGKERLLPTSNHNFMGMGLLPIPALKGYQQLYPLYQDSLQSAALAINGKEATFGKDYITPINTNETGKFKGKTSCSLAMVLRMKNTVTIKR
jgi:hypothetical protein